MADDNPGLLERMVRLQRAREAHEREWSDRAADAYPTAAEYIALLEQEVERVGLMGNLRCICAGPYTDGTPQDDCPVHGKAATR